MRCFVTSPLATLLACTLALILFAACYVPSSATAQSTPNQVSVKSYGAVGDGIHDDAPAINAAFAMLLESVVVGEENQLYFPEGVYLLKSAPTDPNGYISLLPQVNTTFSIVGSGSASTSILWTPANGPLFDLQPHDMGQTYSTVLGSSITLSGLNLTWSTSNSAGEGQMNLANIRWYQETIVNDVVFQGYSPYDYTIIALNIWSDSAGSMEIRDVTASGCNAFLEGDSIGSTSISELTLENVQWGLSLNTLGSEMNIQIDSMKQINVPAGIFIQMDGTNDPPPTPTIMNVKITNSQFIVTENLSSFIVNEAIIQASPGLLYVEGCTFNDTTYQSRIHIDATTGAVTLVDNNFNSGSSALFPAGYDGNSGSSTSLNVTGNTFTGPWTSTSNIAFETIGAGSVIVKDNSCTGGSLVYQCKTGQTCEQQNNPGCTAGHTKKVMLV